MQFLVTVDSYVGIKFERILLEAVVLIPFVQKRSLIPIGTPSKSLFGLFLLRRSSDNFASLIASSADIVL